MSKYSDASFILPQGAYRKAGEIELLKPTDNLLNLKVSRNAPCDEINSLGESVEVAADVPRYDFKAPYVPPVDNSNYAFNGTVSNKIDIPFMNLGTTHTITAKVNANAYDFRFLANGIGNDNYITLASATEIWYRATNILHVFTGLTLPTLGTDFEVTLTRNGTSLILYINGVQVRTGTLSSSVDFVLDGISNDAANFFNGKHYKLEVYNVERTASEVLDGYNGLPILEKYKGANNVSIGAGAFVSGETYVITSVGTTDFTLIGATSSTVGEVFLCTGFGVGTGTVSLAGNTLNLSTGKTNTTWYDREHDIQATITGATLNDSTDFGNNFHGVKTCPSLLTEPLFKNYYFNSRTPVSQTVSGLTIGETYTVNCKGAGIITISEIGGNGQGGSATEVYSYTYVATQTSVVITLEAGHSFDWVMVTDTAYPMNHIETLGASVTKPVDAVTGGGDVNTFNSLEGTFVVKSSSLSNSSNVREVAINDGTGSNRVGIRYSSVENKVEFVFVVSSATVYFNQHTLLNDSTDENTFRIDYKSGLFISYVNNIEVDRQDSGLVPPADTFNQLTLGGSEPYIARTNFIQYYKEIQN